LDVTPDTYDPFAEAISINRGEYCVSKATLSMASSLFVVRLGGSGIGIYEVMPGLIETEMSVRHLGHTTMLKLKEDG